MPILQLDKNMYVHIHSVATDPFLSTCWGCGAGLTKPQKLRICSSFPILLQKHCNWWLSLEAGRFNRLACHTSNQHRYSETQAGRVRCTSPWCCRSAHLPASRDTGALPKTTFTAAACSLHNYLSPAFVLEQSAPTLKRNCQCLLRHHRAACMLPLYPTRILPAAWGQGTLFTPSTPKTCLLTFTLCRGALESYTYPKWKCNQPPKHIWIQRDQHRFLPILPFAEVQTPREQQFSPSYGTGASCGWLCAWSPFLKGSSSSTHNNYLQ